MAICQIHLGLKNGNYCKRPNKALETAKSYSSDEIAS